MGKIFFNWIFKRIFGLRDIPLFYSYLKNKKLRKATNLKNWGTIRVINDTQIDRWVEPMDAGTQSCPYWYSTRLIKGEENKGMEYWVGVLNKFLTPIIPIPVTSGEIVFKIGKDDSVFWKAYNEHNHRHHAIYDYKEQYAHKIIDEADVVFVNTDVDYDDDEIWSTYD